MSDYIIWNGVDLGDVVEDYVISSPPQTNRPQRKYTAYNVPGRNGDVVVMHDAWENVRRSYSIGLSGDYTETTEALAEWLYSPKGYHRLEDSFDPDVYRLAYVGNGTNIDNTVHRYGDCEISFECDPRRFLKSGQEALELTESGEVVNPTPFTAKPFITVYGSGEGKITFGDREMTITDIFDGMTIDCDNLNVYKDGVNLNNYTSGSFPELKGGTTEITFEGGITSLEVVPNWWRL